jgi:hypothetical protein
LCGRFEGFARLAIEAELKRPFEDQGEAVDAWLDVLARDNPARQWKIPTLITLSLEVCALLKIRALSHSDSAKAAVLEQITIQFRELAAAYPHADLYAVRSVPEQTNAPKAPVSSARQPTLNPLQHEHQRQFKRDGEMWRLSFEGTSVVVRHRIGLSYIVELLRSPGKPHDCQELQAAVSQGPNGRTLATEQDAQPFTVDGSEHQEILDYAARKQYRDRLIELESELKDADTNNDIGLRENLIAEKHFIEDELTKAAGILGRSRLFSTAANKARKAVSAAVRNSLKAIQKPHPELASHLSKYIEFGSECRYRGDGVEWDL